MKRELDSNRSAAWRRILSLGIFGAAALVTVEDETYPIASMYGIYLPTFTIKINQMTKCR